LDDDSKQLGSIREREALIEQDATTPLHLIRQKEVELSGRVLKAREKAADTVTTARKQAAEIVAHAETEAETEAKAWEEKRMADAHAEAESVRASVGDSIAELEAQVAGRKTAAVDAIVGRVTRV
jgi:vacuolar-type H+-ATPase subunit H